MNDHPTKDSRMLNDPESMDWGRQYCSTATHPNNQLPRDSERLSMTRFTRPQSLVNTISLLGGPLLEPTDIEWAIDIPTGNAFFEWLVDQLHDPKPNLQNVISGNAIDDEEDEKALKIRMHATLREVALEEDEVLILSHDHSLRGASMASDIPDSDYMPMSRLKKQASYINNGTKLLKQETELLSSRLVLSKKASQKLKQAIKSLQRTLDEVISDTRNAEEGLSELSVKADTTIATTLRSAKALIHTLIISDPDENLIVNTTNEIRAIERSGEKFKHLSKFRPKPLLLLENVSNPVHISNQHTRSFLILTQASLTAIIVGLREHTERFSLIRKKEEVSKNQNLQMEANRLKAALNSIDLVSGSNNYTLTMDPELGEICALLEQETSDLRERGACQALIRDFLDAQGNNSEVFLDPAPDVDAEISHAYCLDQIAILQTYGSGLNQTSSSLDCVLAPLDRLHGSLARMWHCAQEAEALLEVFEDESEDIDMDIANMSFAIKNDVHKLQKASNQSLIALLNEDILTEHFARKKHLAAMEFSEKAWIEALIHEYSSRPIHPSLRHIYVNSPLTTCAPFSFPAQVQESEAQAKDRAMKLEGLVKKLGVRVYEAFTKNDPTAKRLDTFIKRWCRSVPT